MWKLIEHITYLKTPWKNLSEDEKKLFAPYIVNRILSQERLYVNYVNMMQMYSSFLDKEIVYQFYLDIIPRKRMNYKFIDMRKQKSTINPDLLILLKEIFNESERNINYYYSVLTKDDLTKLLKFYGKQDKQIKTLLK